MERDSSHPTYTKKKRKNNKKKKHWRKKGGYTSWSPFAAMT